MNLDPSQIEAAKKRIWNKMQSKLPEKALAEHAPLFKSIRMAAPESSRLKKVQLKERILSILPDRPERANYKEKILWFFAQKRVWTMSILSIFFVFIFAPVFNFTGSVSADNGNLLEVAAGSVSVTRGGQIFTVSDEFNLAQGDKISVSADSMAHIYFVDDSRMTLGPGSEVVLSEIYYNPGNKAKTEIAVDQLQGRVWTQVLNLVNKDSFFAHRFPNGEIAVSQKASFDVNISDEIEIEVSKNLLDIMFINGDQVYQGTLGQGVKMEIASQVNTREMTVEEKNDTWWKFNEAFGKSYARLVEEKYMKESVDRVLILPGNPLYKLKTFQESVRSLVTFSEEGKKKLAVEVASNRLREAEALIARGDEIRAEETLKDYEEAVNNVMDISGEGANELLAEAEELQKGLLAQQTARTGTILLESAINELPAQSEEKMLSASQKLQKVPDLIESGNYVEALNYLKSYQVESRAILAELELLEIEERPNVLSSLLDQKLKDLHLLRIILALMPDGAEGANFDLNAQIVEEMNMIVLSLRERELDRLSAFFALGDYNKEAQLELYSKLKSSLDLNPQLEEQLNTMEDELQNTGSGSGIVIDITVTEISDTHADQTQDDAQTSEESTNNPESHYDL